jgi:hypothetical protein
VASHNLLWIENRWLDQLHLLFMAVAPLDLQ